MECRLCDADAGVDDKLVFCAWEGSYGDLVAEHLKNCEFHHVRCPHGCGAVVKRRDVKLHESTVCRRNVEACTICGVRVAIGDMVNHQKESLVFHSGILEQRNKDLALQVRESKARVKVLQKANADLTKTNTNVVASLLPKLQTLQQKTVTEINVSALASEKRTRAALGVILRQHISNFVGAFRATLRGVNKHVNI